MTLADLFADGEVLGALVTGLIIVGPALVIKWYEDHKAKGGGDADTPHNP